MNMIRLTTAVLSVSLVSLTTGCTSFRHASNDMGKWQADPLLPTMTAPIDLIALLSTGERRTEDTTKTPFDLQLTKELSVFHNADANALPAKRNLLQDRIKVAADQLCDEYKSDVMRKQARANFWLGTTSLFLGTAGALVKGIDVARALSGSAAFTTGVRSEYNQDFYLDQTIIVITKAIDQRQKEIYGLTISKRDKNIAEYSVLQAVDDISRYHASCSLAGALSLTEKAVQSYNVTKSVEDAVAARRRSRSLVNPMPFRVATSIGSADL